MSAVAIAAVLAGCSASGATTSAVTATGNTLHIWISEPPNPTPAQQDVIDAERLAFKQHHQEVTTFAVSLHPVQDPKLSDNARAAIQDKSAIAYLGELAPGATDQTAGITNAQDLLTVSPTDNALELTQATPAITSSPAVYYESLSVYGRTFARVVPSAAQEAGFAVALARSLKARNLFIANDGSDYGKAIALSVRTAATAGSLPVASSQAGAGAIFYGGMSTAAAASFFDRSVSVAPSAKLIAPSALAANSAFTAALSPAARRRLYTTAPGILAASLTPAAKAFGAAFASAYGHQPKFDAIFGYEAMNDVLDAIAQAGGSGDNRAKVIARFFALKNPAHSVLPSYSIDKAGNTSLRSFVFKAPGRAAATLSPSTLSSGG